ncbi:MAG: hypothetical protein KDI39_06145 [Pseudomonadales bacterium]|nr:hypothetical protein [Pseudomonadales bacterium]
MTENEIKNDFNAYTTRCVYVVIACGLVLFTTHFGVNEAGVSLMLTVLYTPAYLIYFYVHILLLRVLYVLGNTPRFIMFALLCILYLIPIVGWIYALFSPFVVYGFLRITNINKVQEVLNLENATDFYDFKKLKIALLNQAKQSS